jgi:hypothetical protein
MRYVVPSKIVASAGITEEFQMDRESGAASLIGMVLALVIVLAAAYFMAQSSGLLGGKGGDEGPTPVDQAMMVSVMSELRLVKQGLEMYRAQNSLAEYPSTDEINSLEQLRRVMPSYMALPDSVSFAFSSYISQSPDHFLLKVRANDARQSILEVSSAFGPRMFEP